MNTTRSAVPVTPSTRPRRLVSDLLLLAACSIFFFFFGLGAIGLTGADEPRYAQIAREMLARHDWVTPVLNGVPWLEKPVLYYWQAMLAYSVFGVSDWAARIPGAVDATLLVFGLYFAARRLWPAIALNASIIAASSGGLFVFGRAASTDIPLAAAFGLSLLCWLVWRLESLRAIVPDAAALSPACRKLLLAGFYVFAALGTLAKGPIAPFLSALVVVVFAAVRRDVGVIRRTLWLPGLALYLVVALPWYVLVQLSTRTFFRVFILEHNLNRYGSNVFKHPQPVWFFLPVMLVLLLPWTVPALAGMARSVREAFARPSATASNTSPLESDARLLLVLWGLLPVIFFSFSGSKLPGYVLPAVPPFALLAALYLGGPAVRADHRRPSRVLIILHALVAAGVATAALLSPHVMLRLRLPSVVIAIAVVIGIAIFLLTVWLYLRWGSSSLRITTLLPVVAALAFLLRAAAPVLDDKFSTRPIARELQRITTQPNAPVVLYYAPREIDYGLNFYRNRAVGRLELHQQPAEPFLLISVSSDENALQQRLGAPRRLVLLGTVARQPLYVYWVGERTKTP